MEYRYALKGINDDETTCSQCGRVELKRVMWLVKLDADGGEGDAFPVGVICGAKMLKSTASKINTKVKNFDSYVYWQKRALANGHPAMKEYNELLDANRGVGFKERHESGLMRKLQSLENEARAWAEQQPIKPMELNF